MQLDLGANSVYKKIESTSRLLAGSIMRRLKNMFLKLIILMVLEANLECSQIAKTLLLMDGMK